MTGKRRKKPSTVRGYKQIWNQHLASHFGKLTLQEHEVQRGDLFPQSLTATQGKVTLTELRRGMIEKSSNPFRISLGNRWVYTTFAIELKALR
jgi:hypothetical protein